MRVEPQKPAYKRPCETTKHQHNHNEEHVKFEHYSRKTMPCNCLLLICFTLLFVLSVIVFLSCLVWACCLLICCCVSSFPFAATLTSMLFWTCVFLCVLQISLQSYNTSASNLMRIPKGGHARQHKGHPQWQNTKWSETTKGKQCGATKDWALFSLNGKIKQPTIDRTTSGLESQHKTSTTATAEYNRSEHH